MKSAPIWPVLGVLALLSVVLWMGRQPAGDTARTAVKEINPKSQTLRFSATNRSVMELRELLNDDYHSTNEYVAMTSALAHQLTAERLRTNVAFLEWATNTTKSVILHFTAKRDIPIYGVVGLSEDSLQVDKVTVNGLVGMSCEAVYDPDPTNEGPLAFIVEGGIHPTILRVQNGFRTISYQLHPEYWRTGRRNIGRMDWSSAVRPLDERGVRELAYRAFREMTGLELDSFQLKTAMVHLPGVLNPNALHADVTTTGSLNAKLYTPEDYVYPFAEFRYDDTSPTNRMHVAFSGQMVQTSPGHGEFIELFAVVGKTEAIFELAERFLGQGTWEQDLLETVRSLDTEQRGQVYRRIFQH